MTPTRATPKVSVNWPARTRNLAGPSSALSVSFTLHPLTVTGSDITFVGDRVSSNLAAYTDLFTATTSGLPGEWRLVATFYANAGETGQVVGTASVNVDLTAGGTLTNVDGTTLSTIGFSPTIVRTVVSTGQTVPFYSPTLLVATAYDASSNVVVVTPGSFTWTETAGSSNVSVAADGTASALQLGSATVSASVDGVSSASTTVAAATGQLVINYEAQGLSYDPVGGFLYASVPNYTADQAAILKINPTTGAITSVLQISGVPTLLTVSGNGANLYVARTDGSILPISLSSFTAGTAGSLGSGLTAEAMIPIPGTTDTWAVSTIPSGGGFGSTYIYDGLTPRPNSANIGASITSNSTGSQIFGYSRYVSTQYSVATIDSNGITVTSAATAGLSGTLTQISWLDSLVIADSGQVVNPQTGALVRTLALPAGATIATQTGTTEVYAASYTPTVQILGYDVTSGSLLSTYNVTGTISGNLNSPVSIGTSKIAVRTILGSPNSILLVGGLH